MITIERHQTGKKYPVDAEHLHRYQFACGFVQSKTVLDVASGEGYGTAMLAAFAAKITGVDIDTATIEAAKRKYTAPNLHFQSGSLENLPFAAREIEVVVSFETIEHITSHEKALSEIKRVLKTDGVLILSTPEKSEYSDKPGYNNPFHKKELYKKEIIELFQPHFQFIYFYSQRYYQASVISPDSETTHPLSIFSLDSGSNKIAAKKPAAEAMYWIVVASDIPQKVQDHSLFDFTNEIQLTDKNEINRIYKSSSYRIGNFIVRALSLFSKK